MKQITEDRLAERTAELEEANRKLKAELDAYKAKEAQRQLNESRLEVLLELHNMANATIQELLDSAIDKAVKLTGSRIGYFATLNDNETELTLETRSKGAMAQCGMMDKPCSYLVDQTGLWGEAVRQRRPVITNDYENSRLFKKGVPEGHVPIIRHMTVPIFDGGHITAIAGVGNKEAPYDEFDVRNLTLLMQGVWEIMRRMEAEEKTRFEMGQRKQIEDQLRVLLKDLENANSELENFAYAVSHDLKAPLRGISSLAGWLREDYSHLMDEQGVEYLEKLVNRTVRMNNLIDGILQYSRIGRVEADPQILKTDALVRDTIEGLSIPDSIKVIINGPLPDVTYDKTLLIQVFQNLIGNAVKYMGKPEGTIWIGFSLREQMIQFCVRDTGIGIEEKHYERIFRIFQGLGDNDDKDSTGIGLALVKKIVERSGGEIVVESRVGEGTAFFFTIPRTPEAVKAQGGLTVLLIDDNIEFIEIGTAILQREGHTVLFAENGIEAYRKYSEYDGDINMALMDIHVPHEEPMVRYNYLRKLRPQMKIVACSGTEFKETVRQLEQHGLNGFIKKPFKVEDLIRIVEDSVSIRSEAAAG